jgi:hypothetical protein
MMLSFSLMPKTPFSTGFKVMANPTPQPTPTPEKPLPQALSADVFTPVNALRLGNDFQPLLTAIALFSGELEKVRNKKPVTITNSVLNSVLKELFKIPPLMLTNYKEKALAIINKLHFMEELETNIDLQIKLNAIANEVQALIDSEFQETFVAIVESRLEQKATVEVVEAEQAI